MAALRHNTLPLEWIILHETPSEQNIGKLQPSQVNLTTLLEGYCAPEYVAGYLGHWAMTQQRCICLLYTSDAADE